MRKKNKETEHPTLVEYSAYIRRKYNIDKYLEYFQEERDDDKAIEYFKTLGELVSAWVKKTDAEYLIYFNGEKVLTKDYFCDIIYIV